MRTSSRAFRGRRAALLLLAHTDTVLADPAEWTRDPWWGDVVDGEVWGRGALDMKGHVAAAAVAFASLAREGVGPRATCCSPSRPTRRWGDFGASWLAREP